MNVSEQTLLEIDVKEQKLRKLRDRLADYESEVQKLFAAQREYATLKAFCIAQGFFMIAPDPMDIAEDQIGVGRRTKIKGLSNCLGIKIDMGG